MGKTLVLLHAHCLNSTRENFQIIYDEDVSEANIISVAKLNEYRCEGFQRDFKDYRLWTLENVWPAS